MKKRSIDDEFSQQLPGASSKDWKILEGQLEMGEMKRRLRGLLWAFPLALVALSSFSGWQGYELLHTRNRLEVLEKVVEAKKKNTALDGIPDTLYHRIIVHDTIYLTTAVRYENIQDGMKREKELPPGSIIYPRETANNPINPATTNPTANEINFTSNELDSQLQKERAMNLDQKQVLNNETSSGVPDDRNSPGPTGTSNSVPVAIAEPRESPDSMLKAITQATESLPNSEVRSQVRELGELNSSPESFGAQEAKQEVAATDKEVLAAPQQSETAEQNEQNRARKLKPFSVAAGVSAGLLFPLAEGIEESSRGVMAGLRLTMKYSPRWSVVFDAQRNNMRFHQKGDYANSFIPRVPPPNPQAKLYEAEVYEYSSWQFGLGAQYTVLDRFRWKPYVRLGWALQKPTHYLIEYKFVDANKEQIESYNTFRNQPHSADIVQGAVGVSYALGERLTASGEATYQQQWGSSHQTPNLLGIKASVVYRLSKTK